MIDKIIKLLSFVARGMIFLAVSVWCVIFWYWIIFYIILK